MPFEGGRLTNIHDESQTNVPLETANTVIAPESTFNEVAGDQYVVHNHYWNVIVVEISPSSIVLATVGCCLVLAFKCV
jgi:hypothetical protein